MKGKKEMHSYFEKLKAETNWLKLFIPIFLGITFLLVVLAPVIWYVIYVVIKNNEYGGYNFGCAVLVSLIYSAILAGVISYNHNKKKS
jgi:hypothetical protein